MMLAVATRTTLFILILFTSLSVQCTFWYFTGDNQKTASIVPTHPMDYVAQLHRIVHLAFTDSSFFISSNPKFGQMQLATDAVKLEFAAIPVHM